MDKKQFDFMVQFASDALEFLFTIALCALYFYFFISIITKGH